MNERATSPEGAHLEPPKPCPFCGAAAEYRADLDSVWCPTPDCIWMSYSDFHGVPLIMWNRRAPRHFTKEEREALEAAYVTLLHMDNEMHVTRETSFAYHATILRAMLGSSKGGASAPSEKP